MKNTRTLHGIELYNEVKIKEGLFFAVDNRGKGRIHDGEFFKGYATEWGRRFRVHLFNYPKRLEFKRIYKTLRGANTGLVRHLGKVEF